MLPNLQTGLKLIKLAISKSRTWQQNTHNKNKIHKKGSIRNSILAENYATSSPRGMLKLGVQGITWRSW